MLRVFQQAGCTGTTSFGATGEVLLFGQSQKGLCREEFKHMFIDNLHL